MSEHLEAAAEEIKRLERCINDLVGVFSLPAVWSGDEPSRIVRILLDVLLGMLRLDFVYARLAETAEEIPIEMVRVADACALRGDPDEIGRVLRRWLGADLQAWPSLVRNPLGDEVISIAPLRLGVQGEFGVVVAGSRRVDFPGKTERLLLSVAANQAAIGMREALLLGEQRRLADELDQRVAQRTQELAATNQELRLQVSLLQHLPVAAWTVTPDGTLDYVNQSWLEYTGQTLAYVQSHPEAWMAAIHPDDREGASRIFWGAIRSSQGFTMETRFYRARDGTYRWHLNRAVALRDATGKIVRFVGTSTDIEDLKQSQENLRRAEERTGLIIDTALDAVVTIDAEGTVTSWNKQAESIFGWTREEAIGRRMSEMIIPAHARDAHARGLRHFLATGDGPSLRRRIEVTAVRRGGVEFPAELQVVPLRLGPDWIFSAFIRDITESKLAEDKLRESELSLRQMTETIPEMLWSATPDGSIDYVNARVLGYTGLTAGDIMGEGWMKTLHPDDVARMGGSWKSCVASGAPFRAEVRIYHAAHRTYRWCVTSALPLRDSQGRTLKWHGTVVDMHDWKQAQEELQNTQAELAHMTRVMTMGALTASIAHEVSQPLSGIITNANTCLRMLAADPPNVDGAQETARRTIRDGNRASAVIARLRALFSKKDPTYESVDLNEATRDVLALSASQLHKSRVVLRSELAEDLPLIMGDRVQLQQVILNLLLNAADAMSDVEDRVRSLLIRTERDKDEHVRLMVRDSGVGLELPLAERLFKPFYTTKSNGMGIGLAVSRTIIESHQGRLWAAPNDGPGATFSFSIPRNPGIATAGCGAVAVEVPAVTVAAQVMRHQ